MVTLRSRMRIELARLRHINLIMRVTARGHDRATRGGDLQAPTAGLRAQRPRESSRQCWGCPAAFPGALNVLLLFLEVEALRLKKSQSAAHIYRNVPAVASQKSRIMTGYGTRKGRIASRAVQGAAFTMSPRRRLPVLEAMRAELMITTVLQRQLACESC